MQLAKCHIIAGLHLSTRANPSTSSQICQDGKVKIMIEWVSVLDEPPPYPVPQEVVPIPPNVKLIRLPYFVIPLWPRPCQNARDLQFCTCATCAHYAEGPARLCLAFTQREWWVCIECSVCNPHVVLGASLCAVLLEVRNLLKPIIDEACGRNDITCNMCERRNCKDVECDEARAWVNRSPLEDLMERMYRNHVDVISVLRYPLCHRTTCLVSRKMKRMIGCATCRRVCYCSQQCKQMARDGHAIMCVSYREIWRQ